VRLSAADRRRQFVGIGLRLFVQRPTAEVALEEVARQAGVSSGLIYHYFPTRTAFHEAVVSAATRRALRNAAPDPHVRGAAAIHQIAERFIAQIIRRRASYLALVYGQALSPREEDGALAKTLRADLARRIVSAGELPDEAYAVAHGWVAYVEDRALQSGIPAPDGPEFDPRGPDLAEPDPAEPDAAEPDSAEPDSAGPDGTETGGTAPTAVDEAVTHLADHCVVALYALLANAVSAQ